MLSSIESISTLVNMNNIYQQQIARNEIQIKRDVRRVENVSSSAKTKKYLQSTLDGGGNFEAYA